MQTISGVPIKWLQQKRLGDFEIHACFTVEMFGVLRWCFTTWALFMLCPRHLSVSASPRSTKSHLRNIPIARYSNGNGKSIEQQWTYVATDEGNSSVMQDAEPGFDFSEEEMKKLKIWPGGEIPYYIDEFSFDKVFRDRIRNFLDTTNSMTGLNFLERNRPPGDEETRWVFFVNRQGLLSCTDHPFKNFTNEGVQKILLGYDCLSDIGQLAQIVLALVGVPPQHNAPNRNDYIEIVKENIMPGKAYLFEILKDNEWLFHEVDYDFASAGHYNLHKYTVNGKATIKPVKSNKGIAENEGRSFSFTDIWKIRMIYNYITKKRVKAASVPECNKLFSLSGNINNYEHESEDQVQPRKKPNKYLGLPDTTTKKPIDHGESKNETETSVPDTDNEIQKEEHSDNNSSENEQITKEGENKEHKFEDVNVSIDESEHSDKEVTENVIDDNQHTEKKDYSVEREQQGKTPQGLKFTRPGKSRFK